MPLALSRSALAWQAIPWLATMEVRPRGQQPVWREGGRYADHELAVIAAEISGASHIRTPVAGQKQEDKPHQRRHNLIIGVAVTVAICNIIPI